MDTDNSKVISRGKRRGLVESVGEINDDRRRLGLGGEHTIQYTADVLQNYTPETYIILLIN